jgi:hypothetical protein
LILMSYKWCKAKVAAAVYLSDEWVA